MRPTTLVRTPAIALAVALAATMMSATDVSAQARGGRGAQPIVLNADDVAAFPEPPADIVAVRGGVARGRLEMIDAARSHR